MDRRTLLRRAAALAAGLYLPTSGDPKPETLFGDTVHTSTGEEGPPRFYSSNPMPLARLEPIGYEELFCEDGSLIACRAIWPELEEGPDGRLVPKYPGRGV